MWASFDEGRVCGVQAGFFDVDERLRDLSAKGDTLERLSGIVDFELFRPALGRAVPRSDGSKGGRPAFDLVFMFKVLVLQASHSLSDERTEFLIKDRLDLPRRSGELFCRKEEHFTGKPHRRFGKEFEAEATRLVETGGRSQKQADDLGIGRSTLCNWLVQDKERERETAPPDRQEDMAAELRRLKRENEVLRQEREILKRAATFFAKEGSR